MSDAPRFAGLFTRHYANVIADCVIVSIRPPEGTDDPFVRGYELSPEQRKELNQVGQVKISKEQFERRGASTTQTVGKR